MNRRKQLTKLMVMGILGMIALQMLSFVKPVSAARPERATNLVIFSWGSPTTPVLTSLGLDKVGNGKDGMAYNYTSDTIINETDVAEKFPKIAWNIIDVVIVDGYLPNSMENVTTIMNYVNGTWAKKGLLFFGGNYSHFVSDAIITEFSEVLPADFVANRAIKNNYLGSSWTNITGGDAAFIDVYTDYTNGLINEYNIVDNQVEVSINSVLDADPNFLFKVPRIAWGSCPLLKERIQTYATRNTATDYTVVEVPSTKEPLIIMRNGTATGRVMYISPGTYIQTKTWDENKVDDWNKAFALWPYFNYMMYLMVRWLDPQTTDFKAIESYADWPFSPIPHFWDAVSWMAFVAGLWVFNFILFFKLGRASRKRKAAADAMSPTGGRPEGAPEVKPEGAAPPIPPKPDVKVEEKPVSDAEQKA